MVVTLNGAPEPQRSTPMVTLQVANTPNIIINGPVTGISTTMGSSALQTYTYADIAANPHALVERTESKPDHEWAGIDEKWGCHGCENTSRYKHDRGAHLYVIREWEIG